MELSACINNDPEDFFPEGRGRTKKITDKAKLVCVTKCSVRLKCLAYTMANEKDHGRRYGVAGGLTATERERLQETLDKMEGN